MRYSHPNDAVKLCEEESSLRCLVVDLGPPLAASLGDVEPAVTEERTPDRLQPEGPPSESEEYSRHMSAELRSRLQMNLETQTWTVCYSGNDVRSQ